MTDYDFHFEVRDDGVAILRLDRPDTLNSLTFEIYRQLERLFVDLETDHRVKVVVLTGTGKGFCSGGNVEEIIKPLLELDLAQTLQFTRMTGAVVRNMRRLTKPIVAAVNGVAAGAGTVLALAADLRILSERASFAFLFCKVGLTGADMGAAHLLPRVVGAGRAAELLLLGDKIDAAECLRIGLANRVVAPESLMPDALALAERLAAGPALANAMTKRMLVNEANMDLESAIEQEAQAQALLLRAADHREFYEAWRDKRAPRFEGR
ncbi:MAG: enoyl-CoA hydratase family protein [Planctomycetes bacterium]|nr:enoyl-CoA hydratase family protein [Planctomycetota bacterium]MCB9888433.1 enoyl-CoA hydratase family protein [Planctomycetota bacterium]